MRAIIHIECTPAEVLMTQWLSAFPENVERLQAMITTMFLGGSGRP